jgi:hypothetical protein
MYCYAGLYGVVNVMIFYNVYRSRRVVIILCKYSIHRSLIRPRSSKMTQVVSRLGRVSLERSVAEWLGVKVGHVVFASDLLDFDEAHINLFADVVDDHEEVLTFLEISLVVCSDCDDRRVVFHNYGG